MKNRKLIYFLAPLVVLIWGLIIYKVISGLNDDDSLVPVFKPFVSEGGKEQIDTFLLDASYRDPFLSTTIKINRSSESIKALSNRRSLSQVNNVPAQPDAQYFGIISNSKSKYKVGLIKIQGKDCLLKEGDLTANKLKIIKLYKDSAIIMQQNFKYTITKI